MKSTSRASKLFRLTQSYLINAFADQLRRETWMVLFEDYVDSRRSREGSQAHVNHCLERLFDEFPDIVAYKGQQLLVAEVDLSFKMKYVDKLERMDKAKSAFFSCLRERLGLTLSSLQPTLVFGRPSTALRDISSGINVWIYNPKTDIFAIRNPTSSESE